MNQGFVGWSLHAAAVGTPYICLQEQYSSGTGGGALTSGAWRTRPLNTIVTDTSNICTLASNQFTLPAGTYAISAKAPGANVNNHHTRLQNITDGTTTLNGTSAYSASAQTDSWVIGRFTITSPKTFELQHQCQTTNGTNGMGSGSGFTSTGEVYASVDLLKLS